MKCDEWLQWTPTVIGLILAVSAIAPSAPAAEIGGLEFDDHVEIDGQILALRGLALKEATFFKVDVYAMGVYAAEEKLSAESLLALAGPRALVVRFLRDIDPKKLAQAWLRDLSASCEVDCVVLLERADEIARRLPAVKRGHTMTYIVRPGGVEVSHGGTHLGSLVGEAAARAVLGAVFGEKAPTKLRDDLLRSLGPDRAADRISDTNFVD